MKKRIIRTRLKSKYPRHKIRPGADSRLKKVFALIGSPEHKPFVPDKFQVEALKATRQSDCLVTVPTGAGKTWIAQQAIAEIFNAGGKSWYASPLKALSNATYLEFGEIFGPENAGILTGDRKENPDAPVIIGTTEVLRNQLYDAMHLGFTLPFDFVVLDEAHFLGDEDRGVVWEETIIYLPVRIPILLLSATIGNADQIAQWISSIRSKECRVIQEESRPVPLFPLFFHPSGTLFPLVSRPADKQNPRMDKKVSLYVNTKKAPLIAPPNRLPPFGEILHVLKKFRLLPAICFLKSRADCDKALELCTENEILNPVHQKRLSAQIEKLVLQNPHISKHRQLWHLKHLSLGSHHSGQLPAWKLILEKLMADGLLDVIFATSTVAAGVNFPARSIVMLNSDRFNGREFLPLNPTEFHQMAGRAGRRGMDKIGFAVILPGKFMDIRHIVKLIGLPSSNVNSQIRINFSMVLNLLLSHTPAEIETLLSKSFASFQFSKGKKANRNQNYSAYQYLVRDFYRHLHFLKENGFATETGELTDDGLWASQLRVDQPLMIAEGFRQNAFPQSDPALLAAAISIFVNEYETDDRIDTVYIPNKLLKIYRRLRKHLKPLSGRLIEQGFEVRPQYLRPMATLYAWATGYSWDKVLAVAELEAGNLVMLILRTADNLRHISGLKQYFPEAAASAQTALDLILRDPVVLEDT